MTNSISGAIGIAVFAAVAATGRRTPTGGIHGSTPALMITKALMSAVKNITSVATKISIPNTLSARSGARRL